MALFQLRKEGDEPAAANQQSESIEAIRKRARYRLIGAGVLVLIGVIGFPLLFDTQPRPIPVDIPIEIPDRNQVKPLTVPVPAAVPAAPVVVSGPPVPAASAAQAEVTARGSSAAATPQVSAVAKPQAQSAAKLQSSLSQPRLEPKPVVKTEPRSDDGAKAQALLQGQPVQLAAAEGRFVVQVGAYIDAAKAYETRLKVEHAGLKTYTQMTQTKDGKRIRVRVGPFDSRAEADKAAQRIKGLDLPAKILTL